MTPPEKRKCYIDLKYLYISVYIFRDECQIKSVGKLNWYNSQPNSKSIVLSIRSVFIQVCSNKGRLYIILGQIMKGYQQQTLLIYRAEIWGLLSFNMKLSLPLLTLLMIALLSLLPSFHSRYILVKTNGDSGKPVTDGIGKLHFTNYIGAVKKNHYFENNMHCHLS